MVTSKIADPHANQPLRRRGRSLDSAEVAVVLVHGRGASAGDILTLADSFDVPQAAYLAPEAFGHSWYPYSFLAPIDQNQPWLNSALRLIGGIVEHVVSARIPRNKIAVVGFSQGGCLATEFVARNATDYGAVVAFTGGLIGPLGTKFNYYGKLTGTNCFLGAGDPDPHVPWTRIKETADVLSSLGATVTLRRYPGMPHTINRDEIEQARNILRRLLTEDRAV
jgi:phospholipase/carboxylesterase